MKTKDLLSKMMLLLALLLAGAGTAGAENYVPVTSASQLVAGKNYLIVGRYKTNKMTSPTWASFGKYASSVYGWDTTISVDGDLGTGNSVSDVTISYSSDCTVHVLTLGGTANAWTLYDNTDKKYVSYTGSSNNIQQSETANANNQKWTITFASTTGAATIKNNAVTGRQIASNGSSTRFACYTGEQGSNTTYLFVEEEIADPSDTSVATTITIDASGITNTNIYNGTAAGSLTATVKDNEENTINGATVTWSSSDNSIATVDENGTVTLVAKGETTITASYAGVDKTYKPSSETYKLTVTNDDPDMLTLWEEDFSNFSSGGTYSYVLTKGSTDTKTYNESLAGGTSPELLVSKSNGAFQATIPLESITGDLTLTFKTNNGNIAVSSTTKDIIVSGTVASGESELTVSGVTLDTKSIVLVFANTSSSNCRLDDIVLKGKKGTDTRADAEFSFGSTTAFTVAPDADFTAPTLTTATDFDGTVKYASDNEDVAAVDEDNGEVIIGSVEGTATITATSVATSNFKAGSASYTITVVDNRADAVLAWSANKVKIAQGASDEDYTLPTLNNPNNLTVTYESSNENIAVEVDGEFIVVTDAIGTATITAKFAGDNSYKPATASYTITIYDANVRDGSESNPYNVADVLAFFNDNNTKKSGVWIKGYIIGGCETNGKLYTDLSKNTNDKLVMADTPTETENYCVLQLPSGDLRTALNVNDKPYNIGVAQILIKGNIEKYCGVAGVKSPSKGSKVAERVSITTAGMATYYTDCALDFTDCENIYAYTATLSDDAITFTRVKKVPEGTGVLLRNPNGGEATKPVPVISNEGLSVDGNKFVGTLTDQTVSTEGYYILSTGSNGIGFYKVKSEGGSKVAAHRAYLDATEATSRTFIGFNDDETTGIETIDNGGWSMGNVYNLQGVRVNAPTKGLYIVNGKKVIFK